MDSPAKPISTEKYNYFMNQSKMQETGRNVKCVIPTCDSVFWTDGHLKQHLTKLHKKSKKEIKEIFKGNSFEERKEISEKQERRKDKIKKDTIENKENVSNIQKTEDRDAKFLNKVALGKHIQNNCKPEKVKDFSNENEQNVNTTFGCFICDSKFSNEAALTEHRQNECRPKKLNNISNENRSPKLMRLDPHRNKNRQKEPDPFETTICKFCNSNFPNKVSLRQHIKFDCKPEKCHFCDMIFRNKDSLLNHVSDHVQKNIKRSFPDQDQKDDQELTLLLPIKKPKIQEDQDILLEVHEEKNHGKILEGNKPIFDRELCSKSFAKEWSLTKHNSASHKLRADSKVYEEKTHIEVREEKNHEKDLEENKLSSCCRICDKSFSKEWMMIKHCACYHRPSVERIPEETKPNKVHKEKRQIAAHKPIQIVNKSDLHCFECNLQFDALDVFNKHVSAVHQDFPVVEKSTAESVDKTGKNVNKEGKFHNILDSKNQKTLHEVHEEEKQYLCAICKEAFVKESSLNEPAEFFQMPRVNQYKCNLCPDKSARYVKNVQERKKEHNCGECNAKFLEESDLNEHVLVVHDRKKEFKCFVCESYFKEHNELNIHIHQIHRVKQYTCNIDFCTAKFSRKLSLEIHIQNFHGTTKKQSEAVTVCEIGSLKCLACEENNRPYKCSLCNNRYSHQESLTKHFGEVHIVEKIYTCEICNIDFSQERSLTYHRQSNHNDASDDIIRNLQASAEIPQTSAHISLQNQNSFPVQQDTPESNNLSTTEEAPFKSPKASTTPDTDTEELLEEISLPVSTLEQPNFTQPPEVKPISNFIRDHNNEKENVSPKLIQNNSVKENRYSKLNENKDKRKFRCEICNYATTSSGNLKIHTRNIYHNQNVKELEDQGIVIEYTAKVIKGPRGARQSNAEHYAQNTFSEKSASQLEQSTFSRLVAKPLKETQPSPNNFIMKENSSESIAQNNVSHASPILGFTNGSPEKFLIQSNSTLVALPETQLTQNRQASAIVEFLDSFSQEISIQSDISLIALPETPMTQNEQDQPSTNPIPSEILQTSPLVQNFKSKVQNIIKNFQNLPEIPQTSAHKSPQLQDSFPVQQDIPEIGIISSELTQAPPNFQASRSGKQICVSTIDPETLLSSSETQLAKTPVLKREIKREIPIETVPSEIMELIQNSLESFSSKPISPQLPQTFPNAQWSQKTKPTEAQNPHGLMFKSQTMITDDPNPTKTLVEGKDNLARKIKNIFQSETPKRKPNKCSKFKCPHCSTTFTYKHNLKTHAKQYHKELFDYTDFSKVEGEKIEEKKESNQVQNDETRFQCPSCDCNYSRKQHLKRHMKNAHQSDDFSQIVENRGGFQCHSCDSSYSTKAVLDKHFRKHHGLEIMKSSEADLSKLSVDNQNDQIATETKKEPFEARKQVDIDLITSNEFDQHQNHQNGNEKINEPENNIENQMEASNFFKCASCESSYPKKDDLIIHIKEEHVEKSTNVKCPKCNEIFKNHQSLRHHLAENHNEVKFSCDQCRQEFTSKTNLARHSMSVHKIILTFVD